MIDEKQKDPRRNEPKDCERDMTCIICPRGCTLHVVCKNGDVNVTGNFCPRGAVYARDEMTHPVRTLTSSVRTANGEMVSVKTSSPIPKEMLFDCMDVIRSFVLETEVQTGDVLIRNVMNTGADIVATSPWKKVS